MAVAREIKSNSEVRPVFIPGGRPSSVQGQQHGAYQSGAALGGIKSNPTEQRAEPHDTFRGDNADLVLSIKALIELNDEGALVPHGLGGHARGLLSDAAARLSSPTPHKAEVAEPAEATSVAALLKLAEDAYEAWDNDRDARVGKLLKAMLDPKFRATYRPDATTQEPIA
jgi:hypothetical protein